MVEKIAIIEIFFSLLIILTGICCPIHLLYMGYYGGIIILSPVYLFLIYLGCISMQDVMETWVR